MLCIGIDCGRSTGVAIWNSKTKCFDNILTLPIHKALDLIKEYSQQEEIKLFIENPNTFVPFGGKTNVGMLQGAGSVKRDFSIWKDFCEDNNIAYQGTRIQKGMKKLKSKEFQEITGCDKRTTVHARDAAMIVYNK